MPDVMLPITIFGRSERVSGFTTHLGMLQLHWIRNGRFTGSKSDSFVIRFCTRAGQSPGATWFRPDSCELWVHELIMRHVWDRHVVRYFELASWFCISTERPSNDKTSETGFPFKQEKWTWLTSETSRIAMRSMTLRLVQQNVRPLQQPLIRPWAGSIQDSVVTKWHVELLDCWMNGHQHQACSYRVVPLLQISGSSGVHFATDSRYLLT
jgi:hypothetical protein